MPREPFIDQTQERGGPSMPSLKPGQRLFNRRYELTEPLGAGGMGVVWRARDHTEHTQMALKFLPTVLVLQEREMDRLREEVRAGKELRHPQIVATYGLEIEDGIAAIVMELVEGQTLQELLEAQPRGFFEPQEIAGWVADIAAAVDYLHQQAKRIHRDLKPANIIVNAEGAARLMDFGISQRIQESVTRHSKTSESQGTSSATLAYASPQQLSGKPAHPADDLYSLGALLYELLTGTPPFYRGAADLVRLQILNERVTPLLERRQELVIERLNATTGQKVPPAVEKAVLACLAKNREQRPRSGSSVLQAFRPNTNARHPWYKTKAFQAAAFVVVLAWGAWGMSSLFTLQRVQEDSDTLKREQQTAESESKAAMPPPLPPKAQPIVTTPVLATKADPFINSLGMKFVPVPVKSQSQPLLFSIWETRSKDYAAFVKASSHDAGEDWKTYSIKDVPVGRGEGESAEESSHPVANVSHDDAVAFCAWLTKKDRASGLIGAQDEYRLPSDVEWSYAVGIGEKEDGSASPKDKKMKLEGVYPWGTGFPPPAGSGNYADMTAKAKGTDLIGNIEGYTDGYATTAPVGSFKENALGLYDLGGNLYEWTSSPWESGSTARVLRGASWNYYDASSALSSIRVNFDAGIRNCFIGFRCVLVVVGR